MTAAERGAPLTEEELGRIATEHVDDGTGRCGTCRDSDGVRLMFPCSIARLYALVIRQSGLLAAWGLPCSCDPDFDLEPAP